MGWTKSNLKMCSTWDSFNSTWDTFKSTWGTFKIT